MKSFSQYLQEKIDTQKNLLLEAKNTHMEHVEDMLLNDGVKGTRQAINFLRDLRDMLAGSSKGSIHTTVKFDGSPAIFAGQDPEDGRFFVAKKSIFNKVPKVYKTPAEVRADTSGSLQATMLTALKYLPDIGIKGIIQGDFMFDKKSLKKQKIDGKDYITFHPNTIIYAVPADSDLAKKIQQAQMGIVWHTEYSGSSFKDLKASFTKGISKKLKKARSVWFDDADYKDVSGTATLTASETKEVTDKLADIGKLFQSMNAAVLNDIVENPKLQAEIKIFNNSKIRGGDAQFSKPKEHVRELKAWLEARMDEKINTVSTDAAKEKWQQEKEGMMSYFKKHSDLAISRIFELMILITEVKMMLIEKMNRTSAMRTFIRTKNGFQVTGQEGYVAIDRMGSGAVKLVDRLEFSRANFSPDVIKGWVK